MLGIPASLTTSFGNANTASAYNVGSSVSQPGVNPASDRALAWATSATSGTGYIGVQLQNNSGQNYVGDVTFTVIYEQWSARNTTSDPLFLDYQANLVSTGNQLTSSGWTQLAGIASPNLSNTGGGATHYIDGNAPGNFTTATQTLTFTEASPWIAGNYLWFRTRDGDISGSDDMNAIDNVSINIQAVPEPSAWILLGMGMLGLVMARRRHEWAK